MSYKLCLASAGLLFAMSGQAEYQVEIDVTTRKAPTVTEVDGDYNWRGRYEQDLQANRFAITGYFSGYSLDKGPWAEAGFLSQSSKLAFSLEKSNEDTFFESIYSTSFGSNQRKGTDTKTSTETVFHGYGVTSNNVIIGGYFSKIDFKSRYESMYRSSYDGGYSSYSDSYSYSEKITMTALKFGAYVMDGAALTFEMGEVDTSEGYLDNDDYFGLNYHQVISFSGASSFAIDARYRKLSQLKNPRLAAIFYFNDQNGLGVYWDRYSAYGESQKDEGMTYHYYFTEQFGVEAGYELNESDSLTEKNLKIYSLGLQARF